MDAAGKREREERSTGSENLTTAHTAWRASGPKTFGVTHIGVAVGLTPVAPGQTVTS